ncbi:MAG: DUF945 domain-containing protein [Ignavibacteria bacterium]|nr:DUF945 domain-containing protein [Ignavibacteria bacterium]
MHNINIEDGKEAFFSLKVPAWHKLGTVVNEAKTSDEVIEIANMNYKVILIPNYVKLPNDFYIKSGSYSTVRLEPRAVVLGNSLSNKYTVLENKEAFNFLDSLVNQRNDIIYETAGVLGDGQISFITVKLPSYIRINNSDDIIEDYLIFINSFDGSMPVTMFFSPIRVVCNNTLNLALSSFKRNYITIRHTKNIKDKLSEGRNLLNLSLAYSKTLQEILDKFAKTPLSDTKANEIITKVFIKNDALDDNIEELPTRTQNILNQINEAIYVGPGQDKWRGTALHLYNGITTYFQNTKKYKSYDRKMKGILWGDEYKKSQKVVNELLKLV